MGGETPPAETRVYQNSVFFEWGKGDWGNGTKRVRGRVGLAVSHLDFFFANLAKQNRNEEKNGNIGQIFASPK